MAELIKEFEAGSLNIEENISLRRFLSQVLNCSPKRVSKKFEGSLYNGKQLYRRKTSTLTTKEVEVRRTKLRELEQNYRESLKVLEMVEASRKDSKETSQVPSGGNKPDFQDFSRGLGTPGMSWKMPDTRSSDGSKKARIAQLKAEIALATLALEPAPLQSGVCGNSEGGFSLDKKTQSNILAALSFRQRVPASQAFFTRNNFQGQTVFQRMLNTGPRNILPADIPSGRPDRGQHILPSQLFGSHHLVGFKHDLDIKEQGSLPLFKRIRLI